MKASELRIGNFVKSIDIEYVVSQIDVHGNIKGVEGDTSFNLDKTTEPIPLTSEWLLKFGFKEYKGYYIEKEYGIISFYFNHLDELTCEVYDWTFRNIKYVHQLQNLYFGLTGEELIIKEVK
jgi:hypothetical protein